jgi:hypothetical protein
MADQQIRPILGYDLDRASEREIIQSTDRVDAALSSIGDEATASAARGEIAVTEMNGELSEQAAIVTRLVEEWEQLEAASRRTADEQTRAANVNDQLDTGRQGVGDLSTTFGAAASAIGGNQALAGVGDLLGFVEYLPVAVAALGALNPAILAIGAAATAGIAIFSQYQQRMQDINEEAEAFVAGRRDIAELVVGGATTADVTAQRDQLQGVRDMIGSDYARFMHFDTLFRAVDTLRSRATTPEAAQFVIDENARLIAELTAETNGEITTREGLNSAIAATTTILGELDDQIQPLNDALTANAFAANDAAADLSADAAERIADAERRRALELEARTMTGESLQSRLDGIRAEMAAADRARQALLDSGEQTAEVAAQIDAYSDQIEDLYEDEQLLLTTIKPIIDNREREAVAAEQLADAQAALALSGDAVLGANEKLVAAEAKLAQLRAESEAKLQEHEEKLRAIAADADAKEAEASAEAGDARLQAERERQEQEAAIKKRFTADHLRGVMERDAGQLLASNETRKKELDDLATANEKRLEEIDKNESKRIDAIKKAADQSERIERDRYNRESVLRQQASGQAIADLQNAERYLAAVRQSYQYSRLLEEQYHQAALHGIVIDGSEAVQNAFSAMMSGLVGIVGGAALGALPLFAPQGADAGGISINVQSGISRSEIRNIAIAELDEALTDAGYE